MAEERVKIKKERKSEENDDYKIDLSIVKQENECLIDDSLFDNQKEERGKLYKCNFCPMTFVMESFFKRHEEWHKKPEKFTCEKCGASFKTLGNFRLHDMKHINGNYDLHTNDEIDGEPESFHKAKDPYKCELCSKIFYSFSSIRDHMKLHATPDAFKCKVCSATFSHMRSLRYHEKNHKNPEKFSCTICGKNFGHRGNLQAHMSFHSNELIKDITCQYCGKILCNKNSKNYHERCCKTKSGQQCSPEVTSSSSDTTKCTKVQSKKELKDSNNDEIDSFKSYLWNLKEEDAKEYPCKFCYKIFDDYFQVCDHLELHTKKKKSKVKLNRKNMKNSSKEQKPKKVKEPKGSKESKKRLPEAISVDKSKKKRMRSNHDEIDKFKLTLWQLKEENVKKYSCIFCPKEFTDYFHIRAHLEEHAGPKYFKCNLCFELFTDQETLSLHKKEKHILPCTIYCKKSSKLYGLKEGPSHPMVKIDAVDDSINIKIKEENSSKGCTEMELAEEKKSSQEAVKVKSEPITDEASTFIKNEDIIIKTENPDL